MNVDDRPSFWLTAASAASFGVAAFALGWYWAQKHERQQFHSASKELDRINKEVGKVTTARVLQHQSLLEKVGYLDVTLRHRFEEISKLQHLAERVSEAHLFEETLEFIWREFEGIFPCDRLGCALYDPATHVLRSVWAKAKYDRIYLGKGYRASLDGSSLEAMLHDNTPRIINDLETFARFKPSSHSIKLIIKEGGKSSLTCPLITAGGNRIGFVFFTSCERDAYDERHIAMFKQIAAMLSNSVEKSHLYSRILAEEQRSDKLLRQILPSSIADRLKSGQEQAIADFHPEVGLLFADLVGFTMWSSTRPPQEIVAVLGSIFSRVDALADEHHVCKLKTMGDGWLGAVGIPTPEGSLFDLVHFAAKLLKVPSELGYQELQFRVGINVGPVVAGVLGESRMVYDVFGDEVNMASRMESTGVPSRIQVSEAAAEKLLQQPQRYKLERRENIQVKGKGSVTTFLVEILGQEGEE